MFTEVLLIVSAVLFRANEANSEFLIGCMCLALGIQNDSVRKTNGISVHSTYMTGMVTTLMQKVSQYCFPKRGSKVVSTTPSPDAAIQILAPMQLSFLVGAVAGALLVVSFHTNGLLVIVLPLVALTIAETKRNLSV